MYRLRGQSPSRGAQIDHVGPRRVPHDRAEQPSHPHGYPQPLPRIQEGIQELVGEIRCVDGRSIDGRNTEKHGGVHVFLFFQRGIFGASSLCLGSLGQASIRSPGTMLAVFVFIPHFVKAAQKPSETGDRLTAERSVHSTRGKGKRSRPNGVLARILSTARQKVWPIPFLFP